MIDLQGIGGLAAMFGGGANPASGGITPGIEGLQGGANPFAMVANPSMGPLATPGGDKGAGTILGMSPNQFASVFGQLANAIGGGKTLGARMGQAAAQMGMAQLQGILAKNQQNSYMKSLKEMLDSVGNSNNPKQLGSLSNINSLLGKAGTGAAPPSLLQGMDLGNIISDQT